MYLKILYLMYADEFKLPVLKLVLCREKDNSDFIISTCQVQDFFVVHDTHKIVKIDVFGSFAVKHKKEL